MCVVDIYLCVGKQCIFVVEFSYKLSQVKQEITLSEYVCGAQGVIFMYELFLCVSVRATTMVNSS